MEQHRSRMVVKICARICVVILVLPLTSRAATELERAEKAVRMQQYDQAFSLYQAAAQTGDSSAQYQLANLLQLGKGVKKNDKQALVWLEKSAAQGNAAAQYSLALRLVNDNRPRAMNLLNESAAQEYRSAIQHLTRLGEEVGSGSPENLLLEQWFSAVRKNDLEQMQNIFDTLNDVDVEDYSGRTALYYALDSNSTVAAEWLLKKGSNVNHRDRFGESPLFLAVAENREGLLKKMLQRGDVQQALPNGETLLHYSVRRYRYNLLPVLLRKKIPLNVTNDSGWTALDLAEYYEMDKAVSLLTARGAKRGHAWPNNSELGSGRSSRLAETALVRNFDDMVKIVMNRNTQLLANKLAANKAFVKMNLADGSSLLSLAVTDGHSETVALLVSEGANIDPPMLHLAARSGNPDVIDTLLRAGADPLAEDSNGLDAFEVALQAKQQATSLRLLNWLTQKYAAEANFDKYILKAAKHDFTEAFDALIDHGNRAAHDEQNRSALWFAAFNKNPAMILQLIKKGVSAKEAGDTGKTPLYNAVESECQACVKMILPYSEIDYQSISGNTALMVGAAKGNQGIVKLLLEAEGDVGLRNAQGNTALMSAVQSESLEVVSLLVEAGASVNRKNNQGWSAIDIAKRNNSPSMDILRKKSKIKLF